MNAFNGVVLTNRCKTSQKIDLSTPVKVIARIDKNRGNVASQETVLKKVKMQKLARL